jgi:hypothetical protein
MLMLMAFKTHVLSPRVLLILMEVLTTELSDLVDLAYPIFLPWISTKQRAYNHRKISRYRAIVS